MCRYYILLGLATLVGLCTAACATAGSPEDPVRELPDAGVSDARVTPPDAPPADPTDPSDPGCTDMVVQLLQNPGFDLGAGSGWSEQSSRAVIRPAAELPVAVHEGSHAAWLGSARNATQVLYQDVSVPADGRDLEISGVRWITTEETDPVAYDRVSLTLRAPGGATLETLSSWSNLDAGWGWRSFSFGPAGSYAGQTVRLYIESRTDYTLDTFFLFDSMSMSVIACR